MDILVGRSRGVLFSGNANNGSNAGFVYANSNNAPSNTNANIRSHLCFSKKFNVIKITKERRPYLLVKKFTKSERCW